ncbi:hypothetical protein DRO22_02455 [Candidatus Bathyarchaeota archaeon]|nr:MAG: hypothetical protein DRO22_02455 [Candidatus Bathyarchaeota archaeon]
MTTAMARVHALLVRSAVLMAVFLLMVYVVRQGGGAMQGGHAVMMAAVAHLEHTAVDQQSAALFNQRQFGVWSSHLMFMKKGSDLDRLLKNLIFN